MKKGQVSLNSSRIDFHKKVPVYKGDKEPKPVEPIRVGENQSKTAILSCSQLLDKIINALENKIPLSIVL